MGHDVDAVAQVKPQVGRDLIVARATGVQFLADLANALDQVRLDVHVHVFERHAPVEFAGVDFGFDFFQALDDRVAFFFREHAHFCQHLCVRDRAHDVVDVQPPIEADRGSEGLDDDVGRFSEAPAPGFFFCHGSVQR